MSNKPRKKKAKKDNPDYIKLTGVLKMHYDGFKFDRKLSTFENSAHKQYNNMLREYLLDCQSRDFTPTKEHVEQRCQQIMEEIEFQKSLKGESENRENPDMVDQSIEAMDFLEIITRQDELNNQLDYVCLKVLGIIPLRGLTKKEREWVEECYKGNGETDSDMFRVTLMSVNVSEQISEKKQEKINDYVKRVARRDFKLFIQSKGLDTKFKYKLADKIKDFWLDGGI